MTARISSWVIFLYLGTGITVLINTVISSNNFSFGHVQFGILILMLVNCLGISHANRNCIGLAIFYALTSYIFIFTRIATLSFVPEEARLFGEEQYHIQYTSMEIAYTIYYIAGFSFFFYLGLVPFKKTRFEITSTEIIKKLTVKHFKKILFIGLMPVIFVIFSYSMLAVGRGGSTSVLYAITSWALNIDIFGIVTIGLVVLVWAEIKTGKKMLFIIWLCVFVLGGMLTGGKGAIYTLALCLLMVLLVRGDFLLRVTIFRLCFFVLLGFSGGIIYVVADGIRYAGFALSGVEVPIFKLAFLGLDYISLDTFMLAISSIGRRLSHFEYMVMIVNNTGVFQRELINFVQSCQVYINFLFLGSPFPNETIYSAQLFKVAYYGYPIELALWRGGHSDYIPFAGVGFLLFGPFFSLIYALACGIFFRMIYCYLCLKKFKYSYFYILCFWFIFNTLVNDSFGLDHFLQKSTIYLFSLLTFILCFKLVTSRFKLA